MLRKLQQAYPNRDTRPLGINQGGTNAKTAPQAVENLNAIPTSIVGQSEGIAPLGGGGKIPLEFLGSGEIHSVSLSGPAKLGLNNRGIYKITDFDFDTIYTGTTAEGTITIAGDVVTFIPPAVYGTYTFTLNDDDYSVEVVPAYIKKPYIMRPSDRAVNTILAYDVHGSSFKTMFASDNHISTSWQFSTNVDFTDDNEGSLIEINDDPDHLVHYRLSAFNVEINPNTTLYTRVRYQGETLGYSEWSDAIHFTTRPLIYPTLTTKRFAREGITNDDAGYSGSFGVSMCGNENGDLLAISATGCDSFNSSGVGGVFIYYFDHDLDVWLFKQLIQHEYDYNSNDGDQTYPGNYANSIALSADGNTLVVSADTSDYGELSRCGVIYVYKTSIPGDFSTYVEDAEIRNSGALSYSNFGVKVAITPDGNYIGALAQTFADFNLTVYTKDLTPGDEHYYEVMRASPTRGSTIYRDLAFTNTTLACGGSYQVYGNPFIAAGIVDIYTLNLNTWTINTTLNSLNIVSTDNNDVNSRSGFGDILKFSGDGMSLAVTDNYNVFIYTKSNDVWTMTHQLDWTVWDIYDNYTLTEIKFNYDGSLILVASTNIDVYGDNTSDYQFGVVQLYEKTNNTWSKIKTFELPIRIDYANFGQSLVMNAQGTMIAIAAHNTNNNYDDNLGEVLVYT